MEARHVPAYSRMATSASLDRSLSNEQEPEVEEADATVGNAVEEDEDSVLHLVQSFLDHSFSNATATNSSLMQQWKPDHYTNLTAGLVPSRDATARTVPRIDSRQLVDTGLSSASGGSFVVSPLSSSVKSPASINSNNTSNNTSNNNSSDSAEAERELVTMRQLVQSQHDELVQLKTLIRKQRMIERQDRLLRDMFGLCSEPVYSQQVPINAVLLWKSIRHFEFDQLFQVYCQQFGVESDRYQQLQQQVNKEALLFVTRFQEELIAYLQAHMNDLDVLGYWSSNCMLLLTLLRRHCTSLPIAMKKQQEKEQYDKAGGSVTAEFDSICQEVASADTSATTSANRSRSCSVTQQQQQQQQQRPYGLMDEDSRNPFWQSTSAIFSTSVSNTSQWAMDILNCFLSDTAVWLHTRMIRVVLEELLPSMIWAISDPQISVATYSQPHTTLANAQKLSTLHQSDAIPKPFAQGPPQLLYNTTSKFWQERNNFVSCLLKGEPLLKVAEEHGLFSPDSVISLLEELRQTLVTYSWSADCILEFLSHLFDISNVFLFNRLMNDGSFCSVATALQLKYLLSRMEEWLRRKQLPSDIVRVNFWAVQEGAAVLFTNKTSLANPSYRKEICPNLSIKQVQQILVNYRHHLRYSIQQQGSASVHDVDVKQLDFLIHSFNMQSSRTATCSLDSTCEWPSWASHVEGKLVATVLSNWNHCRIPAPYLATDLFHYLSNQEDSS